MLNSLPFTLKRRYIQALSQNSQAEESLGDGEVISENDGRPGACDGTAERCPSRGVQINLVFELVGNAHESVEAEDEVIVKERRSYWVRFTVAALETNAQQK